MRFFLLPVFLFCAACFSFSGNEKWHAGSAGKPEGKVYTLCCFISGPEQDWSAEGKDSMIALLEEAQDWLSGQAKRYDRSLTFITGFIGKDKDIEVGAIESGTASGQESVDWVARVLKNAGYPSGLAVYDSITGLIESGTMQVLIFAKQSGISYSFPFSNAMDKELYFLEGTLLYEKYSNGYSLASSSIAHEMLHLFGAWDLYHTYAQPKDREDSARKIFPDDIMLRTSYNISELNIGKLTAWTIGWNSQSEEFYEWFRPETSK
ncbi:MAG: hypothetical protein AB1458_13065 [Bacteroidota bacterium]